MGVQQCWLWAGASHRGAYRIFLGRGAGLAAWSCRKCKCLNVGLEVCCCYCFKQGRQKKGINRIKRSYVLTIQACGYLYHSTKFPSALKPLLRPTETTECHSGTQKMLYRYFEPHIVQTVECPRLATHNTMKITTLDAMRADRVDRYVDHSIGGASSACSSCLTLASERL